MSLSRSGAPLRRLLAATAVAALPALAGCPSPHRIEGDLTAPSQTTGVAAVRAEIHRESVLPPPTMTAHEVRLALWDIAARQHAGEGGKALDDYADRYQAAHTLETRFLAAAAIPDDDEQWKALHQISLDQPKFYWTHAQMAEIYARWKIRDQGEKELNAAYACDNRNPYTYTVRGNLYRNLGEDQLAVRDYATALRADPTDGDARVGLALARKALGNSQGYEAQLKAALASVPTQYEAAVALAELYDQENDAPRARAAWEEVARLAPKNRSAKLALARLAGAKDPSSAIKAYEAAAKLEPLDKNEEGALAKLYQLVGRTDDETKALTRLTQLDPKDLAPWRRLAAIAEQKNSLPAMEATYKSILAIDGKDAAALTGLAKVAERRAQLLEALDRYREALAAGSPTAAADIARLRRSCLVPDKPVEGGTLTTVYRRALDVLEKIYDQRLTEAPAMKGSISAKVHLSRVGKALTVDLVTNTTNDPYIAVNLVEVMRDAVWPKLKPHDHDTFTLKFELPPIRR